MRISAPEDRPAEPGPRRPERGGALGGYGLRGTPCASSCLCTLAARARHCPAPPRPHAASGARATLWQRPAAGPGRPLHPTRLPALGAEPRPAAGVRGGLRGWRGAPESAGPRRPRGPPPRPPRHRARAPAEAWAGAASWPQAPRSWSALGAVGRPRVPRAGCSRPHAPYGPLAPRPPRAPPPPPLWLFFSPLPGASHARALGVRSGPRWAGPPPAGERGGALHEEILAHSGARVQGLQTTRHPLSPPLR